MFEYALLEELKKHDFEKNVQAMILAQLQHESANFRRLEESFNYSAERLLEVFPRIFKTLQIAKGIISLKDHEKVIANLVYANRMGNGCKESGDGWSYRGRGFIMLTGRDNYISTDKYLKLGLIDNPDKAKEPDLAAKIAIDFFIRKPWLMKAARAGDVLEVSSWINLGYYKRGQKAVPLGLDERRQYYTQWIKELA